MVSTERTEPGCVPNRYWVWVLDAAAPVRGAGTETGQGWSLKRGGGGRMAESIWQQLQQQLRVDAVVDTRPKVWSWLGSSVERDESEREMNKLQSSFIPSLRGKLKSLSRELEKDKEIKSQKL